MTPAREPVTRAVTVSIVEGPLVAPVLARVVGVVSARADLPVDRLEDALLVTDVLGAGASRHGLDGRVRVRAQALDRTLVLLVGPLAEGGGDALLEESRVPGFGDVVARLADEVTVVPDDAGAEFVRVELSARA